MEKKYKSLSIFEFKDRFPDDRSCYEYLAEVKWKDGYRCKKCGHSHHCKGI
ncbi:transposase, partial [Cyclobacterium sp.]|uniref:transposase n=1 Tax=Cyclobacterium sp. TaxID=1966343 RepID=UPI0039707F88